MIQRELQHWHRGRTGMATMDGRLEKFEPGLCTDIVGYLRGYRDGIIA